MQQPSKNNLPGAKSSGPPRAGARLTQALLIGAVLVLIIIAAFQFS